MRSRRACWSAFRNAGELSAGSGRCSRVVRTQTPGIERTVCGLAGVVAVIAGASGVEARRAAWVSRDEGDDDNGRTRRTGNLAAEVARPRRARVPLVRR